jgi:hypothetical protein
MPRVAILLHSHSFLQVELWLAVSLGDFTCSSLVVVEVILGLEFRVKACKGPTGVVAKLEVFFIIKLIDTFIFSGSACILARGIPLGSRSETLLFLIDLGSSSSWHLLVDPLDSNIHISSLFVGL